MAVDRAHANLEVVLDWLYAMRQRDVANDDHVVLGVQNHAHRELAGVELQGQLFTMFRLRNGQIVQLRDHARRAEALARAGLPDHTWH